MSIVPTDPNSRSDAELITSVRAGRIEGYGTLYERHRSAAYNLARQLCHTATETDDLVSEAFARVFDALREKKGPDSAFRAYLLTTLRHTAYDKTRKDRRVDLAADLTTVGGSAGESLTVPFADPAVAELERTLAATAFSRLPQRWQAVLWHLEIERQSPTEVAPLLGLSPNAVSALAYRAREGLRQAYLQAHLAQTTPARCRAAASRLGAWARGGLSRRERAQVENHLDRCLSCQTVADEIVDVNSALRAVVAPLVLGGAATAYLTSAGATTAPAAAIDTAGVAGAAQAGAGPRQFVGVAASGIAIATAVAIALAGGHRFPSAHQPAPQPPPSARIPAPQFPDPVPPPATVPAPATLPVPAPEPMAPPSMTPAPEQSPPGPPPARPTESSPQAPVPVRPGDPAPSPPDRGLGLRLEAELRLPPLDPVELTVSATVAPPSTTAPSATPTTTPPPAITTGCRPLPDLVTSVLPTCTDSGAA